MSSFDYSGDDSIPSPVLTRPFDHDAHVGYDSHVPSRQFESFDSNSATVSPIFNDPASPYSAEDDVFRQHPAPLVQYQSTIFGEADGTGFDGAVEDSNGPILPPPTEMGGDEGYALRGWRSTNAIRLEEKEKRERDLLNQIIDEADEFKVQFYRRRITTCENNKISNREREKVYQASQEKFHSEADKNHWKAIPELLPNEVVPAIEKRRGKKDQEKRQPFINVVQGPKPGKPADLSRMRQILLKLKHNTPPHLHPTPPPAVKTPALSDDPPSNPPVSSTPQTVVVT